MGATRPQEFLGDDGIAWNSIAEEIAAQGGGQVAHLTARQVGLLVHGDFAQVPEWPQAHIDGTSPDQVNTYTDGGVEFGTHSWLALGTWGLYLPEDNLEEMPSIVRSCSHACEAAHGSTLGGQTTGPALSSARQEAFGLYAALARPQPQNI